VNHPDKAYSTQNTGKILNQEMETTWTICRRQQTGVVKNFIKLHFRGAEPISGILTTILSEIIMIFLISSKDMTKQCTKASFN
jgi:hypothetical protein